MNLAKATRVIFVGVFGLSVSSPNWSQGYPSRPVRVIVPFNAGSTTDIVTRIVGQKLSELWAIQVIVDNRAGAGGNIGAELAARSAADGYTLLLAGGSFTITPSLQKAMPYDPIKDFLPITQVASTTSAVMITPSLPVNSVKELIDLAKRRPGQLLYGSGGIGTTSHLGVELFNLMAGIKMVHVPYKEESRAVQDTISGRVQLRIGSIPANLSNIKVGKLKALAVTSTKRSVDFPELPTVSESGVPGYEMIGWYGALVPAGTSQEIVRKLQADFVTVIRNPDTGTRLLGVGAEPVANSPGQFAKFLQAEMIKWPKVVKSSGATAD